MQRLHHAIVQFTGNAGAFDRRGARSQTAKKIDVIDRWRHQVCQVLQEPQLCFRAPAKTGLEQQDACRHIGSCGDGAHQQQIERVFGHKSSCKIALLTPCPGPVFV